VLVFFFSPELLMPSPCPSPCPTGVISEVKTGSPIFFADNAGSNSGAAGSSSNSGAASVVQDPRSASSLLAEMGGVTRNINDRLSDLPDGNARFETWFNRATYYRSRGDAINEEIFATAAREEKQKFVALHNDVNRRYYLSVQLNTLHPFCPIPYSYTSEKMNGKHGEALNKS
jgi:hypothetical protein